jgi:hypothetical protein
MHHVSLQKKHWIEKAEAVKHIHMPKNAMHIQNRVGHLKERCDLQSIVPALCQHFHGNQLEVKKKVLGIVEAL